MDLRILMAAQAGEHNQMHMVLSVADPACMEAVRRYAAKLSASGLPVRIDEIDLDDGWLQETAVSIEWGPTRAAAEDGEHGKDDDWELDWELEDDLGDKEEGVQPSQEQGLDDGQGRLAEHYLRTVQFLARNVEAARAWIGGNSPLPKKKPR